MDVSFHCDEYSNFPDPDRHVRAFLYTDYAIKPHSHDFYEMNIVLGGHGIHQIESAHFPVQRGDAFIIPPLTVHSYYDTHALDVYHILLRKDFICANREEAKTVTGYVQLMETEPFLRKTYSEQMFLHLSPLQLSEIMHELRFVEDGGPCPMHALAHHTVWKVLYLASYYLSLQLENETKRKGRKYEQQILDTLCYLHLHYSERITVDHLAKRLYLSRSTLLRSFEELCGCSPIRYLHAYRVQKAREMLKSDTLSKAEIAHLCGFYDQSHMQRCLKKAE